MSEAGRSEATAAGELHAARGLPVISTRPSHTAQPSPIAAYNFTLHLPAPPTRDPM